MSISTTLSGNGANVIVKVVNPTEEPAVLCIKGDWESVKGTNYEYYAPGSLTVANSMENKHAVALQRTTAKTEGNDIVLSVPALSAGVLTITK
jgi:alpha-N-arabinofuranosidase